jgi:hypothetical protein
VPDPGRADAGGQFGKALAALPAGILAVLLVLGLLVITVGGAAAAPPPGCGQAGTATNFGAVTLDAEQMGNAGTIVRTTAAYAGGTLPAYAAVVALAAADTESGLRNLPGGDRDSAGLFQIRTGLHGADVATDPVKSTLWFLDALVRVPNWRTIPLTEAAANVERPALAYRGRYASAQALATAVVAQLWPTARSAITSTSTRAAGGAGAGAVAGPINPGEPDSTVGVELCPTGGPGRGGGTSTVALACTVGGAGTVQAGPGGVPIRVCDAGRGVVVDVTIAGQVAAMMAAADSAGLHLSGGGFRPDAKQVQLRRQHCGRSSYDIYQRPPGECSPPTALPGTSMHQWGLAVDWSNARSLIASHNNAAWQWLSSNAGRFGFANFPSEPWHWSTNGH